MDAAPPSGASGRGFNAREIFVGFGTQKDASSAGQLLGELNFGDQEAIAKAIVKDINSRGGVAGRKLVPVFHDVKTSQSTQDPNGAAQAACASWTEDRQVFAVVNLVGAINNDTLFDCLARRQTPIVVNDVTLHSSAQLQRYSGFLYAPSVSAAERLSQTWIQRLGPLAYFEKWDPRSGRPGPDPVKIGLIYPRTADGSDYAQAVERAMARESRKVDVKFQYSGELSEMPNDMNQAVLRFSQAGVTHVLADFGLLFFSQAADAQRYRPRYAFTSLSALILVQPAAPKGQLNGALGVGHVPTADVDNRRDPGNVSGSQANCQKVMQRAGQDTSNRQALLVMLLTCDGFNFLAEGVDRGGLSPTGLQRGSQEMGSLPPAATFGISFKRGRQDGASAVRDMSYREACECFVYQARKNHGM